MFRRSRGASGPKGGATSPDSSAADPGTDSTPRAPDSHPVDPAYRLGNDLRELSDPELDQLIGELKGKPSRGESGELTLSKPSISGEDIRWCRTTRNPPYGWDHGFMYVGNYHPPLNGKEIDLADPKFRKVLGPTDLAVSIGEGRYRPAELGEVERLIQLYSQDGNRRLRITPNSSGGFLLWVENLWGKFVYKGPFGKFFLTAALEQRGDVNRSYWPPRTSSRPSGRLEG